jgi:formylglycine-generating enzyme required for sulfatase activity
VDLPITLATTWRHTGEPSMTSNSIGFRCARSAKQCPIATGP